MAHGVYFVLHNLKLYCFYMLTLIRVWIVLLNVCCDACQA